MEATIITKITLYHTHNKNLTRYFHMHYLSLKYNVFSFFFLLLCIVFQG